MSKDMKKVAESAEKSTNTVFNAMVDGIGEHISQLEESAEKGKETAKKVGELILGKYMEHYFKFFYINPEKAV